MSASDSDDSDPSVESLAEDLVRRWTPEFRARDWSQRLQLLNELHEQLLEDLGDLDFYCAVSPVFIRKLIDKLAEDAISSTAQAQIYANSADKEHRRVAGEWLEQHRPGRPRST